MREKFCLALCERLDNWVFFDKKSVCLFQVFCFSTWVFKELEINLASIKNYHLWNGSFSFPWERFSTGFFWKVLEIIIFSNSFSSFWSIISWKYFQNEALFRTGLIEDVRWFSFAGGFRSWNTEFFWYLLQRENLGRKTVLKNLNDFLAILVLYLGELA